MQSNKVKVVNDFHLFESVLLDSVIYPPMFFHVISIRPISSHGAASALHSIFFAFSSGIVWVGNRGMIPDKVSNSNSFSGMEANGVWIYQEGALCAG